MDMLPPLYKPFWLPGQYLASLGFTTSFNLPGNHYRLAVFRDFLPKTIKHVAERKFFRVIYALGKCFPVDEPIILSKVSKDGFLSQVFEDLPNCPTKCRFSKPSVILTVIAWMSANLFEVVRHLLWSFCLVLHSGTTIMQRRKSFTYVDCFLSYFHW